MRRFYSIAEILSSKKYWQGRFFGNGIKRGNLGKRMEVKYKVKKKGS